MTESRRPLPASASLARKLALLAARTDSAIVVGDANGAVEWVNAAWSRMTGQPAGQAIGKPMLALLADSEIDGAAVRFVRARLERGEPARLELGLSSRSGERRWVDLEVLPAPSEDGARLEFVAIATDITERRQAQTALAESEARYRTLVEQCPNPVAVHRGGQVVYVNPAAVRLWGGEDASELVGRPVFDFVHPDSRPLAEERIRSVLEEGITPAVVEAQMLRKDGTPARVLVHTAPLLLEGKPAVQALLVDLSGRDAPAPSVPPSGKLGPNREAEKLAHGLAGELDGLATSLLEASDLLWMDLRRGAEPGELRRIRRAGLRLAELTGELRACAGEATARTRPVDISSLLLELSPVLESELGERMRVSYDLAAHLPAALADPGLLRQVIQRLVRRVTEAGDDARDTIRIRTGLLEADATFLADVQPRAGLRAGPYVTLQLQDGSLGLGPRQRERVFEPFFGPRAPRGGLGLAPVLGLLQAQRGAIKVESTRRRGTIFTVLLRPATG